MKLTATALGTLALLGACASAPPAPSFDQSRLPQAVQVPAGNKAAVELVGVGEAFYQCLPVPGDASRHAWTFVRPEAKLMDRNGKQVGRYFGPPATWDYWAGSRVTGTQVATAAGGEGNLALQLVKADAVTGSEGALTGSTYVQRVNIKGGSAPSATCEWLNARQEIPVKYQADYIFYKPM